MFEIREGNYKGALMEVAARYFGARLPAYFQFEYGEPHARVFLCICIFNKHSASAKGRTKIEAEQFASRVVIDKLQKSCFKKTGARWDFTLEKQQLSISDRTSQILDKLMSDPHFDKWSLYGDAILRVWIVRYLFKHYPEFREGMATRITSEALRDETRATIAREFFMDRYIRTVATPRILAHTLSAVIGKLTFLTTDIFYIERLGEYFHSFVDETVADMLSEGELRESDWVSEQIDTTIHNFIGELQELVQKIQSSRPSLSLPTYTLLKLSQATDERVFTYRCNVAHYDAIGTGITIMSAKQSAAKEVLKLMKGKEVDTLRTMSRAGAYTQDSVHCKNFTEGEVIELTRKIGYLRFATVEHLNVAFTHPSCNANVNYQRLEWLGDALLRKIILHDIVKHYPELCDKGHLSSAVDRLVSAVTQAKIAQELDLAKYLLTLAVPTAAMLSDLLEALIAAVYLDTEIAQASDPRKTDPERVIFAWFRHDIELILGKSRLVDELAESDYPPLLSNGSRPKSLPVQPTMSYAATAARATPSRTPVEKKPASFPDLTSRDEFPSLVVNRK